MEYRNKIFSELFSAETRIGLLPVGQFSKVKLQLNNKKNRMRDHMAFKHLGVMHLSIPTNLTYFS